VIEFYSAPTPNCQKVAILLEETGVPYQTHEISLPDGEQKGTEFLAVNPNGRVPAIVDRELDVALWESGAILIHLSEKTGRFLPSDAVARSQVMQWLMFQMSGVGPNQGAANVFSRYVPDKIPWVIERYRRETTRLYRVLDDQLARQPYVAGDYSIADMALYPWVHMHDWAGVPLDGLDHLEAWRARVSRRAAVECTREVYEPDLSQFADDIEELTKNVLD
jgi:glutathione S-transferase